MRLDVLEVIENEDGTLSFEVDYDREFKKEFEGRIVILGNKTGDRFLQTHFQQNHDYGSQPAFRRVHQHHSEKG